MPGDAPFKMEIHLFSLFLLGTLLATCVRKQDRELLSAKLFLWLLIFISLMVLLELLRGSLGNASFPGGRAVILALTIAYYAMEQVPFLLYYVFIDLHLLGNPIRTKKLVRTLAFVWLGFLVPDVLTAFTGWFFYLDGGNRFVKGPAYFMFPAFSYAIVIFGLLRVLRERDRLERNAFWPLFLFPVPTIIGGTVQLLRPGNPYLWAGAALSMLIIFLHIQNERLKKDYLTGVWNRRFLDEYLEFRTRGKHQTPLLSGLFMDVDGFKKLNDKFGHETGDQALQMAASILKSCIHGGDFLARYAGDEFVIILETASPQTLTMVISRIEEELNRFNSGRTRPYELRLSIGSAIFNREADKNGQGFLARMDGQMYEQKQKKR